MSGWVIFLSLVIFITFLLLAYLYGRLQGRRTQEEKELPQDFLHIYQEIQKLPTRVLATIQGSINPQKGKVAELLTYAELRYDYDVIIPLGQPIDFIGIKKDDRIDFIEVKSGQSVLTHDQRAIQELIQQGRVHFRKIQVRDEEASRIVSGGGVTIS